LLVVFLGLLVVFFGELVVFFGELVVFFGELVVFFGELVVFFGELVVFFVGALVDVLFTASSLRLRTGLALTGKHLNPSQHCSLALHRDFAAKQTLDGGVAVVFFIVLATVATAMSKDKEAKSINKESSLFMLKGCKSDNSKFVSSVRRLRKGYGKTIGTVHDWQSLQ
jgi:hypothetical protein